ncbi:MAG: UDP-N-acetylmuramoyl-L-alanine--D-glutamate ligase [Acidimicrobiia bacterium]|nr:UDP-N-acetylmuramoyl-L-alanine--D-glutamate ligase [Acidimicrobiia bacterium]
MTDATLPLDAPVIVGFGVTGQAVAAALVKRGFVPTVVEDRPKPSTGEQAEALGVELIAAPSAVALEQVVLSASALLPSPGVPDHHPAFQLAAEHGVPILSEFDLAHQWDDRPIVAITGTNGKTTVTMMVTEALVTSGRRAEAVGNTEVPLVAAIDDPSTEVFVVEASSFRLGHSRRFSPTVAAWLNFAPDHLDAHVSLEAYEQAKASIWSHLPEGALVVANADDPVVTGHLDRVDRSRVEVQRFSMTEPVEWRLEPASAPLAEATLVGPEGPLVAVADLPRRQPHDVANALAASAIALGGGATAEGVVAMLRGFIGLPHRLEFLGSADGVAWYNDSKATVPHATVVAVSGFDSVVLIAGGRNKGLSMAMLASTVPPVRAVVATGDAADEIATVFGPKVPVERATSMDEAVELARGLAGPGDVVVLSPACTSFDWYANYGERGRHFVELVKAKILTGSQSGSRTPKDAGQVADQADDQTREQGVLGR